MKENGATKIFMFASHGILSGPAIERINESCFDKVIISNTLNQEYKNLGEKINVPIIVRLEGTNSEEAKNIIDNSGLKIYSAIEFKEVTTQIKEVLS